MKDEIMEKSPRWHFQPAVGKGAHSPESQPAGLRKNNLSDTPGG